jgi:hypothetical protein
VHHAGHLPRRISEVTFIQPTGYENGLEASLVASREYSYCGKSPREARALSGPLKI